MSAGALIRHKITVFFTFCAGERDLKTRLLRQLQSNAAVVLIGARQVGKTTLALEVSQDLNAEYRDLENPEHRAQIEDINLFATAFPDSLIILDEVQHVPEIFAPIRGSSMKTGVRAARTGSFFSSARLRWIC